MIKHTVEYSKNILVQCHADKSKEVYLPDSIADCGTYKTLA